jgi:RNA-binding protein Musashi
MCPATFGRLAGSVTSESLREFFSQFGKVIDSTVMLDRETGRSKGFGFVSFENTNVQPFLGFGNLEIDRKLVSVHFVCLSVANSYSRHLQIDVKLGQPRYQRDSYPNENGEGGGAGGNFSGVGNFGVQGNFGAAGGAASGGNTPFDPQALAALYTRMFQMTGGAQMNPVMMGIGGMGMGRGMGMGMGAGMGTGMGMGGGGMGGSMAQGGGAGMNPKMPRGPRGGPNGPAGPPGPMGSGAGVGLQQAGQRGQHNYHPYAR